MNRDQALKMIDEYLLESEYIVKEWIDCLIYCRECIIQKEELAQENKALHKLLDKINVND